MDTEITSSVGIMEERALIAMSILARYTEEMTSKQIRTLLREEYGIFLKTGQVTLLLHRHDDHLIFRMKKIGNNLNTMWRIKDESRAIFSGYVPVRHTPTQEHRT